MASTNRRRRWLAFAGSFAVYLLPIVGPHAAFLLGEALVQDFSALADEKSVAWVATDVGVALALQALAFATLARALAKPIRLAVFVVLIPVAFGAVETLYLGIIPGYFLIEPDTAPELANLPEQCAAPNVSLAAVPVPVDLPTLVVDEWWLQFPDGRYGVLRGRDCAVTMAGLPQPTVQPGGRADFTLGLQFFVPGHGAVVERLEPPTGRQTWWLAEDAKGALQELVPPANQKTPPVLSNDGTAVVWLQDIPGTGPPVLSRLIVRGIRGGISETTIDLSILGPASYVVGALDARAATVTLWRNEQLIDVGFDGATKTVYLMPGGVRPYPGSYVVGPNSSWLYWEIYKEKGRYQALWSTPQGRGDSTLPKGRGFTAAALDASLGLVAISATTTLSIGSTPDVLAIVRTRDGSDVYRRYLPRYTRSPTVFFNGGLFGYSDLSGTHVLRLGT